MAEGVMRHLARERGINVELDSAGTGNWHAGEAPDHRAQAAMRRGSMDISDLRARQVRPTDFERFDLLLAMDADNLKELHRIAPNNAHRAVLIMDYASGHASKEVPDPYYGSDADFDAVRDQLMEACTGVLDSIPK